MKNLCIIMIMLTVAILGGCTSREKQILDEAVEIVEQTSTENTQEDMSPNAFVTMRVGDQVFSVDLAGNSSADAFFEKLKDEDIEVEMHDCGNFEKVGDLPWELPANDEEITTDHGGVSDSTGVLREG